MKDALMKNIVAAMSVFFTTEETEEHIGAIWNLESGISGWKSEIFFFKLLSSLCVPLCPLWLIIDLRFRLLNFFTQTSLRFINQLIVTLIRKRCFIVTLSKFR